GTPPNTILKGTIETMYGIDLSFAGWMAFGVPLAWVFIFIIWFYLTRIQFPQKVKELPGGREIVTREGQQIRKASPEVTIVCVVVVLAALAWLTRSFLILKVFPGVSGSVIAILFAIVLLLNPPIRFKDDRLLDWNTAVKLPWGILLLFG